MLMEFAIDGVGFTELRPIRDERGVLTEMFRSEIHGSTPVQWNLVSSNANVIRGLHVHLVHEDFLTVVSGSMVLALIDLRASSRTFRRSKVVRLEAANSMVRIPVGVGHAFCFDEQATFAYGVTDYWRPADELGCRWDDPDLGFDLGFVDPVLSERDRSAGSLAALIAELARAV